MVKLKIVEKIEQKDDQKIYVCGDVHGMYDMLMDELDKSNFNPTTDLLISVGDLIDRGPKSLECLKLINKPCVKSVRGNHEELMLSYLDDVGDLGFETEFTGYYPASWFRNGGDWYQEQFERTGNRLDPKLLRKIANLPLIIVVEKNDGTRVNIVHAEFPYGCTDRKIDDQDFTPDELQNLVWGRSRIAGFNPVDQNKWENVDAYLSRTYVGHTPLYSVTRVGSYNYIDCGAVFNGILTMLEI